MNRLILLACAVGTVAVAAPKEEVSKPLKALVNAVRYGKDVMALKGFSGDEQGRRLMQENWEKGTDAQRKEFITLFHTIFAKVAFPKFRDNYFKYLDTILYDEPVIEGDKATIASTILVNHPLKKQELKVRYDLIQTKAGWQIVDAKVLGDSMLKGIQEDQIAPLFKEGGWDGVLKAMREKAKELESVPLK